MAAALDRLFVPAAFVSLLSDMPAVTAPAPARVAWLNATRARLRAAVTTNHGLVALRLAGVINRERHAALTER